MRKTLRPFRSLSNNYTTVLKNYTHTLRIDFLSI